MTITCYNLNKLAAVMLLRGLGLTSRLRSSSGGKLFLTCCNRLAMIWPVKTNSSNGPRSCFPRTLSTRLAKRELWLCAHSNTGGLKVPHLSSRIRSTLMRLSKPRFRACGFIWATGWCLIHQSGYAPVGSRYHEVHCSCKNCEINKRRTE